MSTSTEKVAEKHRLNETWVMWYDYQDKKFTNVDNWSDSLQTLGKVSDAEGFWGLTNEIGDTQELPISSNLHFFRNGIQPMWEDKRNMEGGKWVLELISGNTVQHIWSQTLLFCISELTNMKVPRTNNSVLEVTDATVDKTMDSVICGAVLSPRKNFIRISIWTSVKDSRVMKVGSLWKEFAEIPETQKINFKAHESAMKGSRELTQDVYSL
ncbi:translation initiation factor 4E [Nematocida displodere]|uniref:Translation initiation factor 4E n=1 Tax=Nematocida displodere TaxID=1805483 RepID=A0A177EG77_9MICR|nr:translation initiation factor 4E [Nematocida displodere]